MKRLLFVCARNRLRSPTAEAVFASVDGVETSSAGTAPDAECFIDLGMVEWADAIFVMEARQKKFLQTRFAEALKGKTLVCLGVPDRYTHAAGTGGPVEREDGYVSWSSRKQHEFVR